MELPIGAELRRPLPNHLKRMVPLIALGRRDKYIADELTLTPGTVRAYIAELRERTGLNGQNWVALALWCRSHMAGKGVE